MRILAVVLTLFLSSVALCEEAESIRVLTGGDASLPVVVDLSGGRVYVDFDMPGSTARNLRYRVLHRGVDWDDEGLAEIEWQDGLNEIDINDVSYSHGTLSHYVHYGFAIPGDDVRLKISGNYVAQVYDVYKPDSVLLEVRFRVSENVVGIGADVNPRTDIDYLGSHQQLRIEVSGRGVLDGLPSGSVVTIVERNRRGGGVPLAVLKSPSMLRDGRLIYEHQPELIFDGGNEWRRFEIVDTEYPGIHVERVGYDMQTGYYALLMRDMCRNAYSYDRTQRGGFTVRSSATDNSDIGAEYVTTFFTLECNELYGKKVCIDGEFTGGKPVEMRYNPVDGVYEGALRLKQGAYDYRYVSVDADGREDVSLTEGNFCDTSNPYYIYVYYRRPGERYDRLAGWGMAALFNSKLK